MVIFTGALNVMPLPEQRRYETDAACVGMGPGDFVGIKAVDGISLVCPYHACTFLPKQ